jgi:hypothetical protein
MRPKGTAEELEERRRKCFELLDSGKTAKEMASILGASRVKQLVFCKSWIGFTG